MFLLDHTCVAEDFLEAISPPIIALLEGGSSIRASPEWLGKPLIESLRVAVAQSAGGS